MVGALVPMVPEGLVLMTSIAFAVGVVRLGRRQCLVQELPAIEGLARVDVVCADKTGTLTENGMRVSDLMPLTAEDVGNVLAQLAADDPRPNASMAADRRGLQDAAGLDRDGERPVQVGDQVEWHLLRRARQLGHRRARRAARSRVARCRGSRADRRAGAAGAAARIVRPVRRRPRRTGSGHPGRAGGARAAGPPRRPRHAGLLCVAEGHGQGDLRRQRGVRRRGRGLAGAGGRDDGRPQAARRSPTSSPTRWRSTPPSAGCGPTRSARWCTRCSPAATPSR